MKRTYCSVHVLFFICSKADIFHVFIIHLCVLFWDSPPPPPQGFDNEFIQFLKATLEKYTGYGLAY